MSVEVDPTLREFLDWHAQQKREGYTIANVMLGQEQFATEVRTRLAQQDRTIAHVNGRVSELESNRDDDRQRIDHHGAALVVLKRRARRGPDDEEMDTGQHDLTAIRKRLEEKDRVEAEAQTWWKRSVITWVAIGLGFIASTTLTILITKAINDRPATTIVAPK